MNPTQDDLNAIISVARQLEAQGYFERARKGDQKAASLFARLTAYTANPNGRHDDYGWLSKSPGESQVDGYAEDAVCFTDTPSSLNNVVDLVNGAGAPNASIGGAIKERRPNNLWVKPQPLSDSEMSYLLSGGQPIPPQPPKPKYPTYEELGGDEGGKQITRQLEADYTRAGRKGLDGDCGAWQQRVSYDFLTGICKTVEESITKHRAEWCQTLGIDVE